MLGGRYALLIATNTFDSTGLQQLRSPVRDVEGLASVLKDPLIGDFDVTTALDQEQHQVTRAIESFFRGRNREDLLLLHVSSHGLKADHGELYFAVRDTERELLASTAISAAFLQSQMSRCRAKSIVLLLDCCYSGAFILGAKGDSSVHVKDELTGHGRAVLTATNRTEYAWEGDHLSELEPEPSNFTGAIIDGLKSGDADRDRDGRITVSELYDYVYDQVRSKNKMQSPQMWTALEYQVVVARSPFAIEGAAEDLRGMESAVDLSPIADVKDSEPLPDEFTDVSRRDRSVAQLKRALPDPVRRIEVFDLIDNAVTDVIDNSTIENRPVIGPVFESNLKGYRVDSDLLLHLIAIGVFHGDEAQDRLWMRSIERLSRLRDKKLDSFNDTLERLRHYPALLATWAMGIASVLGGRDQLIASVLTKPCYAPPFNSQRRQAPAHFLNPLRVVPLSLSMKSATQSLALDTSIRRVTFFAKSYGTRFAPLSRTTSPTRKPVIVSNSWLHLSRWTPSRPVWPHLGLVNFCLIQIGVTMNSGWQVKFPKTSIPLGPYLKSALSDLTLNEPTRHSRR